MRRLERASYEIGICYITAGLGDLASKGAAIVHDFGRCFVVKPAPAAYDNMAGSMVCHMNSQTATETFDTSDNKVRDDGLKLKSRQGWPDR